MFNQPSLPMFLVLQVGVGLLRGFCERKFRRIAGECFFTGWMPFLLSSIKALMEQI